MWAETRSNSGTLSPHSTFSKGLYGSVIFVGACSVLSSSTSVDAKEHVRHSQSIDLDLISLNFDFINWPRGQLESKTKMKINQRNNRTHVLATHSFFTSLEWMNWFEIMHATLVMNKIIDDRKREWKRIGRHALQLARVVFRAKNNDTVYWPSRLQAQSVGAERIQWAHTQVWSTPNANWRSNEIVMTAKRAKTIKIMSINSIEQHQQ